MVHPALARWVATVKELLPLARPAGRAGLAYLPGGEQDYARAIRIYTTLPLAPAQLHQTGLDHVAALQDRAVRLRLRPRAFRPDRSSPRSASRPGSCPPEAAPRRHGRGAATPRSPRSAFFPAPAPAALHW